MTADWFIHGALIFGMVVVVPMALVLNDRLQGTSRFSLSIPITAAFLAAASFWIDEGALAAAMCVPWVAVGAAFGLEKLGNARTLVARLAFLLPHAYLVFGAGWLVISRYGGQPMDFPSVIVELTAVHFHYAGFVAPVIIAFTRSEHVRARGPLLFALWLALVASPLTALGFVYSPAIGAVGAVTFMVALWMWSVIVLVGVVRRLGRNERFLMSVAAVSVLMSMALAAVYAIGVAAGETWVDIPTMARTHGVLNALGFSFCGAAGWLLVTGTRTVRRP